MEKRLPIVFIGLVLHAQLLLLLASMTVEAGQKCATCTALDTGGVCNVHSTCNDTQVCQLRVYTDGGGHVKHDYGCSMPQRCTHTGEPIFVGRRSSTNQRDICNICCNSTAMCNTRLSCTITSPTQTGQTCATCTEVAHGTSCHAHSICSDNEVCQMTAYTDETGQNLYDYGCALPQACLQSVITVRRRSSSVHHGICNICCNDTQLCNEKLTCGTTGSTTSSLPTVCSDLSVPSKKNGIYTIYPYGTLDHPVDVRCEFDPAGNAWTVIQRRFNGSVSFYRDWQSYKHGFGSANGEYWIGNEIIHQLTSHTHTGLRIVMSDFDGTIKYAYYSSFHVGDETSGYKLFAADYTGTAGNSLMAHNGYKFLTFDRDIDHSLGSFSCASKLSGGWWYLNIIYCYLSDLNGLYLAGHITGLTPHMRQGIIWYLWRGFDYSLKTTTMMIKNA